MQMRKDSTKKLPESVSESLLGAKLYGQQLCNAFKSIDKMKCNPLAIAAVASLLRFLSFSATATATVTAFKYLQTALSFV